MKKVRSFEKQKHVFFTIAIQEGSNEKKYLKNPTLKKIESKLVLFVMANNVTIHLQKSFLVF